MSEQDPGIPESHVAIPAPVIEQEGSSSSSSSSSTEKASNNEQKRKQRKAKQRQSEENEGNGGDETTGAMSHPHQVHRLLHFSVSFSKFFLLSFFFSRLSQHHLMAAGVQEAANWRAY